MRKRSRPASAALFTTSFFALLLLRGFPVRAGMQTTGATSDVLAKSLVERAENEVAKTRMLVEQGILPKSRLTEAEEALADAQDEATLTRTLYGTVHLQEMTAERAASMLAAAERRVEREQKVVDSKREFVAMGILARSEFDSFDQELESRKRVLELARNRAKLLDDLRQMAEAELRLEHAAQQAGAKTSMTRYDGNGLFNLGDLTTISNEFERRFHHALPVSALGQTLVHRAMGLDHRNRVDVAVNPDGAEGVWLRQLLERLRIPYLAFRSAVAGAATAPHIHIGPGSTRLALAQKNGG